MSDAQLEILASRAGLAVDWIDANGRPQRVTPDALRAAFGIESRPDHAKRLQSDSILIPQPALQGRRSALHCA